MENLAATMFLSLFSVISIYFVCRKKKKIAIPVGLLIVLLLLYNFSFIVVENWAIDKGMNIIGFMKSLFLVNFIVLMIQNNNYKETIDKFRLLPYSAVVSVIISIVLAIISNDVFFLNNRLQGVFLYANSYGLFLLICLLILLQKAEVSGSRLGMAIVIMIGILLTNSRAIILLTILFMCIEILLTNERKNKKRIIILMLSFCLAFVGMYKLLNFEKRVNSEMFQSSEFLTRLLYYSDALKMIEKKPYGYGYMGWYYAQATEKTAVYDTKYVHNSVLQFMLDVGVIPTILIIILICLIFFQKGQNSFNRMLLILIIGHSMIDIDLEYLVFIAIILGMVRYETKEYTFSNMKKNVVRLIIVINYIFHLGTLAFICEDYTFASYIIPFYTDAIQEELYSATNKNIQLKLGEKSLNYNKYVSGGYEALENYYLEHCDYGNASICALKRVKLNKYDIEIYEEYVMLLNEALDYYRENNDKDRCYEYANKIMNVEQLISDVLIKTNPMAYKVKHVPNLEISCNMLEVMKKSKNIIDKSKKNY